jgi:signal transduction histidine kinase
MISMPLRSPRWSTAMTERRSFLSRALTVGRVALAPPSIALILVLLVIWALTAGGGYFWPMWPYWAILLLTGLRTIYVWDHSRPEQTRSRLDGPIAYAILWAVGLTAIWGMSGGGYFWPVWPMLGFVILLGFPWMLGRSRDRKLEVRVDELTRTRAGAVDVQASELRRIERDLHDGAQARLVALSMQLGRAEDRLAGKGADDSDIALVRQARHEATAAIAELRDLARGISPPVLADRGLAAAVQSLADRTGPQVTVNTEIDHRPPPAVENAAYFVVAEALTNAAKHSPGAPVRVTVWHEHSELGIVVADEGLGGADPTGSGLTGLRQRVEALDGWLEVRSPVGEGTTVRAILPCG